MRILFLSDIHVVPSTLEAAFASASTLGYDKIVLLGDLLYHGPRNGVPNFYDPVKPEIRLAVTMPSWIRHSGRGDRRQQVGTDSPNFSAISRCPLFISV